MIDALDKSTVPSAQQTNFPDDLSSEESSQLIAILQNRLGFSAEQAESFAKLMTPTQARTFLALTTGDQNITREGAQEFLGLTEQEVDSIFGDKKVIGIYNNPFGDAFLTFMALSYSLELDFKLMMRKMLTTQVDTARSAAEDRKSGAIGKFAMAMTAAAVTFGLGGMNMHNARKNAGEGKDGQPNRPEGSPWTSPIGASLITQPINAIGEFTDQMYQYHASQEDINSQEASALYQQFVSMMESTERRKSKASENL